MGMSDEAGAHQYHFEPTTYLAMVLAEVPAYRGLQRHVAEAAKGIEADLVLELGVGTGATASVVLAVHPHARLVGIDESEPMLALARNGFPAADLRVQRLEDPLPAGRYDLVVSALAVITSTTPRRRICSAACTADCARAGGSCWPTSSCLTIPRTRSRRLARLMTSRVPSLISSAGSSRQGSSPRCSGSTTTSSIAADRGTA
jgi:Methyltransferase domain